jgi:outer membrane immunogenic protein
MLRPRKSFLLATVSVAALASLSQATNAEPVARLRPADMVAATWAGLYVGVHAGAALHTSNTYDLDRYGDVFGGGPGFSEPVELNRTSALVGAHIGYNWQTQNLVYGVEADFSGVLNGKASSSSAPLAHLGFPTFQRRHEHDLNWLSTFRARIGVQAHSTMVYATGGLALAGIKNRWGLGFTDNIANPFFSFLFHTDETRVGWTAGGGIEHRIAAGWTARVEGLYMDFGTSDDTQHVVNPGGTELGTFRTQWENSVIVARAALTRHWSIGD